MRHVCPDSGMVQCRGVKVHGGWSTAGMAPCHRLNVEEARPAHARLAVPAHSTEGQLKYLVAAVLGRAGFVSEHCWKTAEKHGPEAKALNNKRTENCRAVWHRRKHSKPLDCSRAGHWCSSKALRRWLLLAGADQEPSPALCRRSHGG